MKNFKNPLLAILLASSLFLSCESEDSNENETTETVVTESVIGTGSLESNSMYAVTGNFEITLEDGVYYLNLDETYLVDANLPDLVIYFSVETETQEGAVLISDTTSNNGVKKIEIPADLIPEDYLNVLIYCRNYDEKVGFGTISFQ